MSDKAREKTDKQLHSMTQQIGRTYKNSPALKKIKKEYMDYMDMVAKRTETSFKAFKNESDINIKQELKKVYMGELEALTSKSKTYNNIIKRFVEELAKVNQQTLDVVNDNMTDIYMLNYNQVADDCRKAGIKVNG